MSAPPDTAQLCREEMAAFEMLPKQIQNFLRDCPVEILATDAYKAYRQVGTTLALVVLHNAAERIKREWPIVKGPKASEVGY